jgi:hypothetical protein
MRAKDEDGKLLEAPHKRLPNAPALEQRAIFAISADRRACGLTLARKLTLVRKAIDHVVDGDNAPAWIFRPDKDDPENRMLSELWRLAVREVGAELRA